MRLRNRKPSRAATTVSVERSSLEALKAELTKERGARRLAEGRVSSEATTARRAVEQAARARLERDEYRRVLAAAIANEHRALGAVREMRADLEERAEQHTAAVRARGEVEGRLAEMQREVAARDDRLAATNREHQTVLDAARREAGAARERARELGRRLPVDVPASVRLLRARARFAVGAAAVSALAAVALLPEFAVVLLAGERGAVAIAAGLGPWAVVVLEFLFLGSALLLSGAGLRALRSAEVEEREARRRAADVPLDRVDPGAAGAVG